MTSIPRASAARRHIPSAVSIPSAAQVLAIPLLHTMARAVPFSRCRFVTVRGAPLTKFRVYTAAAAAGRSEKIRARSFLLRFFRMPQWIPAAEKPPGGGNARPQ